MNKAAAILGISTVGLILFMASLAIARREYAKELLVTSQATATWKESDSVNSALVTSYVLADLSKGDQASAVKRLCQSLARDIQNIEQLAEISQVNQDVRLSALQRGNKAVTVSCVAK